MSQITSSRNMNEKTIINLGKPTKRGIKKCPKCGIYNGTRGIICKNKRCDAVFKDSALNHKYRKFNLDAVCLSKIVRKVYSVRVRDRGPDQRGFVQLPLHISAADNPIFTSENALCFVNSCQRLFDDSILKCHENDLKTTNLDAEPKSDNNGSLARDLLCIHIKAAIKAEKTNMAVPLESTREILNLLKVSQQIKEELWQLATENEGPIVQRVSRNVMVVKCLVSPKHPLGFLHFAFGSSKCKEIYDKFHCSCMESNSNLRIKCIHYYACVCALASNSKYLEEFAVFINAEFSHEPGSIVINTRNNTFTKPLSTKDCLANNTDKQMKMAKKQNKRKIHNLTPQKLCLISGYESEKVLITTTNNNLSNTEKEACWTFTSWLSYVTESINQTMQFENYANLNTLNFSIPVTFYEEFKKRLPAIYIENSRITSDHQIDYSSNPVIAYHIMNILHLKEIFDTPEVKLKISTRFFHDNQKGFIEYIENDNTTTCCQSSFIFFLNVGQTTVDDNDNTNNAFLIEWLPNVLITHMGQLKLQYKYGRKGT